MKNKILVIFLLAVTLGTLSCRKEEISNRDKLILGKWDCIDYSDTARNEFQGRPPIFISNLYEKGYDFRRNGLMWTRNRGGDNKMFTDKRVECEWMLLEDNHQLSLIFPDDFIETYDIIEMTRNKMTIKGNKGFFAETKTTYVFEKK
ncbi:MAG: hypothetical protein RLP15_11330 [Cryomorphaceae bacterium]